MPEPSRLPNRTIPPFVRSVDASFPHTSEPAAAAPQSRWVSYMRATGAAAPRTLTSAERELADEIYGAYDARRERALDEEALLEKSGHVSPKERRQNWLHRQRLRLMRSPFAPLFFRLFILGTTVVALAFASDIYGNNRPCRSKSTHIMAIVVNSLAIPYTLYIAWDEFFSPPIGLRKANTKLRLLIFDLVFIIFYSADVALAFHTTHGSSCGRQWGLVVTLLVGLLAWLSTFLISLFRLMYRMDDV